MKKIILIVCSIILLALIALPFLAQRYFSKLPAPHTEPPTQPNLTIDEAPDVQILMQRLDIPWDIAFLPEQNGFLVTERDGTLLYINKDAEITEIPIPDATHSGEAGLLGIVLHPNFSENRYLYLYLTTEHNDGLINRVERYTFNNASLSGKYTIVDNIPGALYHDGGRMAFGPEGLLYITTGDATKPQLAQDLSSLAGKTLRVNDDGSIPEDNPFGTAVYSYGHRNSQGLAWDDAGRLWSTEHGRSGIQSGLDEINLIEKGANYGWPESEGDTVVSGTRAPAIHSGASDTWAPASTLFWDGSLFFGGLRGEALYEAVLNGTEVVELKEHFKGQFGRIRSVVLGPDGLFYLTTSNRDGRGSPSEGDDKIIRINPQQFRK